MYRRGAVAGTLMALIVLATAVVAGPVGAQDGGDTPSPTIHIVQPDETLFQIAMYYGTTVEAIVAANDILDARYITVGQELVIPRGTGQADAPLTHIVQPGETLATVARTYRVPVGTLAAANHIVHAGRLVVGQPLTIDLDAADPDQEAIARLYRAQAGDNLFRIALKHNVPINRVLRANAVTLAAPVMLDQTVWLPGRGQSLTDLPAPFAACELTPVPLVQGQTVGIHLRTTTPATITGQFLGYPVQFVTQDGQAHHALFGIHTFAAGGVYPLALTATQPDGTATTLVLRVQVQDGNYGAETISLVTEMQDLLAPEVTTPEWERVAHTMSDFTPKRYIDDVMIAPSDGMITSYFGTRRLYNGGVLDTFHSGVDFGAAMGSPILAPADGVVVLAEDMPVRGNATIIDHGWGVYSGYWHQSTHYVAVGDMVTAGQAIGAVGSTGRSTGPHLHWELWVGGVQVDPLQWLDQSFVPGA